MKRILTKDVHYETFLAPEDKPAIEMNKEKMEKFAPQLKKFYYDPARYKTYLEQLGIPYPTFKATP
jgi:aminobenzoyl-glutamate utilization protein B